MIMSAECEHFLQNKLKISSLGATRHSPRRGKLFRHDAALSPKGKVFCRVGIRINHYIKEQIPHKKFQKIIQKNILYTLDKRFES